MRKLLDMRSINGEVVSGRSGIEISLIWLPSRAYAHYLSVPVTVLFFPKLTFCCENIQTWTEVEGIV